MLLAFRLTGHGVACRSRGGEDRARGAKRARENRRRVGGVLRERASAYFCTAVSVPACLLMHSVNQ